MNFKYLDLFFVLVGLVVVVLGSQADNHNFETLFVAIGGALVGAAFAFMGVRSMKPAKKSKK